MNIEEIEDGAAKLVKQGRLWRDPAARRRFETETGHAPIISGNGLEVEAQHQSGRTAEYHENFAAWASSQP